MSSTHHQQGRVTVRRLTAVERYQFVTEHEDLIVGLEETITSADMKNNLSFVGHLSRGGALGEVVFSIPLVDVANVDRVDGALCISCPSRGLELRVETGDETSSHILSHLLTMAMAPPVRQLGTSSHDTPSVVGGRGSDTSMTDVAATPTNRGTLSPHGSHTKQHHADPYRSPRGSAVNCGYSLTMAPEGYFSPKPTIVEELRRRSGLVLETSTSLQEGDISSSSNANCPDYGSSQTSSSPRRGLKVRTPKEVKEVQFSDSQTDHSTTAERKKATTTTSNGGKGWAVLRSRIPELARSRGPPPKGDGGETVSSPKAPLVVPPRRSSVDRQSSPAQKSNLRSPTAAPVPPSSSGTPSPRPKGKGGAGWTKIAAAVKMKAAMKPKQLTVPARPSGVDASHHHQAGKPQAPPPPPPALLHTSTSSSRMSPPRRQSPNTSGGSIRVPPRGTAPAATRSAPTSRGTSGGHRSHSKSTPRRTADVPRAVHRSPQRPPVASDGQRRSPQRLPPRHGSSSRGAAGRSPSRSSPSRVTSPPAAKAKPPTLHRRT